MKRIALFLWAAALGTAAFSVSAYAQQARGTAVSTSAADFVEGNLKFHQSSAGFIQVTDTAKNQNAGTVILPPGGAPVFAAMPGYDIKSAYEKHMNGKASTAASADTGQGKAAAAQAPSFDTATKTVTLADGKTVTFLDSDNLKVQMPGPAGSKTYDLHFHKAGGGGFMRGLAGRQQGRVGGSLGGGGVKMSMESQNGMPGGEVYDTAQGTTYANSGFEQAKAITAAVREAVDVVKKSAQPDLAKLNVVKSLLSNNLGM